MTESQINMVKLGAHAVSIAAVVNLTNAFVNNNVPQRTTVEKGLAIFTKLVISSLTEAVFSDHVDKKIDSISEWLNDTPGTTKG